MKNIAVIIPSFTIDYSIDILNGIYDYFNDKNVRVLIAHTKYPGSTISPFDYQCWASVEYIKSKEIDGYILVSGLYNTTITKEQFDSLVAGLAPRPVVSIGVEIDSPNVYSISTDCSTAYKEIVGHLKNEHSCKNIAFFSANNSRSEEALARYNAFTQAMQENGLEFNPNLVFEGNFTDFGAETEILKRYETRHDIDFDAVICANDMMAVGCERALLSLGVKIPNKVKIIGFDDTFISKASSPKLSTINQGIQTQGYKAAELIDQILDEQKKEKNSYIPLNVKYRQSCGCIECNNKDYIYKTPDGEILPETENPSLYVEQYFADINEKNNLITLMDTLRCSNTLKQFFYNLRYLAQQCNMAEVYISVFKDVMDLDPEDIFELPEELELLMFSDVENNINTFKPGVTYNPKECFFGARAVQNKPGIYILHPIFSGLNNYGIMFCRITNRNFADYIVHMKIIVNSIAQSYDYTNQITQTENLKTVNSDLKIQSRTDELTSILNRRGFIEQGQSALDLMQETDKAGVIFFADMDGLKIINDKYGHEMGDLAIKLQAKVLKEAFRAADIVGRLSGDEFGVVAVGMNLSYVDNIKLKIKLLSEKVSRENELPFVLSCSLGAVDLQKSSVLKRLLSEADKELYEEKKKKRNAGLSQNIK